jgi:hypothetical protein
VVHSRVLVGVDCEKMMSRAKKMMPRVKKNDVMCVKDFAVRLMNEVK